MRAGGCCDQLRGTSARTKQSASPNGGGERHEPAVALADTNRLTTAISNGSSVISSGLTGRQSERPSGLRAGDNLNGNNSGRRQRSTEPAIAGILGKNA